MKWRRWWVLAHTSATCVRQLKSQSICTPRYLKEDTCAMPEPCMVTVLLSPTDLGSTNISNVFFVLIWSWCESHQLTNVSTAALWTLMSVFLVRRLRMTVSSENFTMCWLGAVLTQSLVYNVNKNGELTQPWGAPVLQTAESDKDPCLTGMSGTTGLEKGWLLALPISWEGCLAGLSWKQS